MIFERNPQSTWLFCFAHPDDELTIAAWMKQLCDLGATVHSCWTHSNPIREEEARQTAKLLGQPQDNLTFLHGLDGDVCTQIEALLPDFQNLMARINPSHIAVCAFEQGHLDHDATNFLVLSAATAPVYEFPLYHCYHHWYQTLGQFSSGTGVEELKLSQEESLLKKRLAKEYPSQNIWKILFWYEAWHRLRFRSSGLLEFESLRPTQHTTWFKPNHAEPLASQVLQSSKWQRWVQAMEKLEADFPGITGMNNCGPTASVQAGSVLSK